ncbi:Kinesin-like protein KIN-14R [Cardamine amara subsp. amara]|uniref:Kinesin-like protein KIN-14R n=1 Tax=Cardamine amara subsp. amara TaxID=228776 RepID=A0ABD1BUL1_CARAN
MEDIQIDAIVPVDPIVTAPCSPEIPNSQFVSDATMKLEIGDTPVDDCEDSLGDSMLCDPNSRLVPTGFTKPNRTADETIMFINAGGDDSKVSESELSILRDTYFQGGDVLRTEESIVEAGDYPFIYQSARVGNFCYRLNNLIPGEYFIDFHFAEIINTNGPKGIRVFNVYVQDEKVLAEFDIFSVVGANRPLLLVDLRVVVMDDGLIRVRFEGISGSPVVCGICVRKAPQVSVPRTSQDYIKCENCATEIEISPTRKRLMRAKAHDKYEKKIEELSQRYQHKTNECHEAWMSLTSANEQLEKVRMELDNTMFEARSLDQTVATQADCLKSITSKYENDKRHWANAIVTLQEKIEIMKREQSQLSQEAHECVEGIPELYKMVDGVQALVSQCEDLKQKYSEEQAKRKELYNYIQETKGNIRVFCRCRPLNKEETSTKCATIVDFDGAKDGELGVITGNNSKKSFKFDRVYTPKDGQVDVFADASPMVVSVLDGYNVCIFAYGQTGTGKTFTMEGTLQNRGVNYRTVEQLFEVARERRETISYSISVSVLEVYNEQIRDLLATSPASKKLEIKQSSEGYHHVPGLVEAEVENINEVWNVLQAGSNARSVGSNNVNEHSSRSHCMLSIMVRAKNLMNGDCTKSKLWLVDLAGSERLAKTDVQGERLKEAQNINRSLSALGDVIYALATKSSHIPYRNSKLTHLLQDSLGGDSKTLMFVQISPSEHDVSETLSSLNFATRVRGVELGPARKQVDTGEIQKMKAMVEKARQESRSKDESIKKLEENIQNLEGKNKGRDHSYRSLQEKNKELENQLDSLHNQSEKQNAQLQERLKSRDEICSNLQQKVKELECKLRERHQSDSAAYNQKVKDLENKLKESEGNSLVWQQKVKEFENKLKESEGYSLVWHQKIKDLETKHKEELSQEAVLLRQKIKELEMRLKEQEQHIQQMATTREFPDVTNATPNEVKTCFKEDNFGNENMESNNNNILRTSNRLQTRRYNSLNLNEITKKKRASRSGETENNGDDPQMKEKRIRKSDPPKVIARVVRPTRPVSGSSNHVPVAQKRVINREPQVPVGKERDSKKKIWSR